MIKNIIALLLITYGVFGNSIFDILDTPTPEPAPIVLKIDEPSETLKAKVVPIAATITDNDDRVEVALFFLELSERVQKWDLNLQQLNDVVVTAAVKFFQGRLHGKYDGFDQGLTKLIIDVTGSEVHILSEEEKLKLHEAFEALAWALVQR
jgi:hypothetical protein